MIGLRSRTRFNLPLGLLALLLGHAFRTSALALSTPAPTEAPAYSITGTVVSARDGAPIPNCHLTATLRSAGAPPRPVMQRRQVSDDSPAANSDSGGHFRLSLPSAGMWQIAASGRGFRPQNYEHHDNFFSSVALSASTPTYDLIFTLEPDSAITGSVLDEAGEGIRNARVTLFSAEPASPDLVSGAGLLRSATVTDDRGRYEFDGLAPGEYNIAVQAEPWYAAGLLGRRSSAAGASQVDPSLDVVYPQSWFPGVGDRHLAETIILHDGEVRQASFNLTPVPATHLVITVPSQPPTGFQRGQSFPTVERVSADGAPFLNTSIKFDPQGQVDIGGLSSGLYRVTVQRPDGPQSPAFIRVSGGALHNLDLSAAISPATLTLHLIADGDTERVQTILTDPSTGVRFSSSAQGTLQRRRNAVPNAARGGDRKLDVPPGEYQVSLAGDPDLYLESISINHSPVRSRMITVASGATTLDLKLTRGRASIQGTARVEDKPCIGAMVMLVPETFGQTGSITVLRRDQTNTDGSFSIESVIPGNYILVAIDKGWGVNWRDPLTLQRYLLHGVPVSLQSSGSVKQDLIAQKP